MCIIIVNRKKPISRESFCEAYKSNPDGFGLMTTKDGHLFTYKTVTKDAEECFDIYRDWRTKFKGRIVLHFRISTGGKLDDLNCHPHIINENLALMHNGIMSITPTEKESDTTRLKNWLSGVPDIENHIFKTKEYISRSLGMFAGYGNKFVFLRNDGRLLYYNKDLGHYDSDKNWYSNRSYVPTPTYTNSLNGNKYNYGWEYGENWAGYEDDYPTVATPKTKAENKSNLITKKDKVKNILELQKEIEEEARLVEMNTAPQYGRGYTNS